MFLDASYHLFYILKDGTLAIQHNRYGAAVSQLFPLLGYKMSLSLQACAMLYSSGFIIYYMACYWVCGSVLKQYRLALCLLLFNTLFVTDTFYWIPSELPQGVALLTVMFALLTGIDPNKNKPAIFLLLPVIAVSVFFHALLVIPAVFITLYFAINRNGITHKPLYFIGSFCFLLCYFLKQQYFVTGYESHAMKGSNHMWDLFPNWINLTTNRIFLKKCFGNFIWIPACSLLISAVYIKNRRWLSLLLFGAFMGGYILLVNTTYPHGGTPDFYIENLYLPLGVFLAIPLVYDVLPQLPNIKMAYLLVILILSVALIRICVKGDTYAERLAWKRSYMTNNKGKKLIVAASPQMVDTLIMPWGTPYEFWLLSTIETGKTESIFITDRLVELEYLKWDRNTFITNWGAIPYADLPQKYFIITDTVSRYNYIK